jgi:hypothetical protein
VAFGAAAEEAPTPVYCPLLADEIAAGVEAAGAAAAAEVPEPPVDGTLALPDPEPQDPAGALSGKFNGLSFVT